MGLLNAFQRFTEDAKQKVAKTYGAVDKHAFRGMLPGGASRKAGEATPQFPVSPGQVMQSGLIPVVPLHTSMEGPMKFAKSIAGPLGMPFNVTPALTGRKEKFQDEISRATRTGDTLSYGMTDAGYQAPSGLKEEAERGIYGQWNAKIKDNGDVVLREGIGEGQQPYDTNRDADWHNEKADEAWEAGNYGNWAASKIFATYDKLNKAGWTNNAPQGTQEQVIGNIDFENTISESQSRPTAPAESPAMQAYEVAVGDTLTAIAAKHGLSIDEIARKNNITNVNMLNVGQQLKL